MAQAARRRDVVRRELPVLERRAFEMLNDERLAPERFGAERLVVRLRATGLRAVLFLAVRLRATGLRAVLFLVVRLRATGLRAVLFLVVRLRATGLRAVLFLVVRLRATGLRAVLFLVVRLRATGLRAAGLRAVVLRVVRFLEAVFFGLAFLLVVFLAVVLRAVERFVLLERRVRVAGIFLTPLSRPPNGEPSKFSESQRAAAKSATALRYAPFLVSRAQHLLFPRCLSSALHMDVNKCAPFCCYRCDCLNSCSLALAGGACRWHIDSDTAHRAQLS